MQNFTKKRDNILQLMKRIADYAKTQNREDLYKQVYEETQNLADGKLTLVVAGEFKRGKSSLINMLLEEPGLCPVDVHITTCSVSVITYGKRERITVYLRRDDSSLNGLEGIQQDEQGIEITREQLKEYTSEQYNKNNAKGVSLIKVELPNKLLEKGLVLVDTPGVGGMYREHSLITMGFMAFADAILFVCDTQNPVSESEIQFLQKSVEYSQNFIFAMTHKDCVLDYEKVRDGNQNKLAGGLNLALNTVKVIPVSSKSKALYLETEIEEYLDNSNYPELEKEIWDMLTGRGGSIMLLRALAVAGAAIGEMRQPIADELAILETQSCEQLKQMEIKIKQLRVEMEERSSKHAEWNQKLSRGIQEIGIEVRTLLNKAFVKAKANSKTYLDDDQLLKVPDEIRKLMIQDIEASVAGISRKISEKVTLLSRQIEDSAGINMKPFGIGDSNLEYEGEIVTENLKGRDTWEYLRSGVIGGSMGLAVGNALVATVGGAIGGIIGGIAGLFGGGVGAIPGAIVGAQVGATTAVSISGLFTTVTTFFGIRHSVKSTEEKYKEQRKREIMEQLSHILEDLNADVREWSEKSLGELQMTMSCDFIDKINKRIQQFKETEQKLHDAYKTSQVEATKQIATLKPQYNALTQYQDNIVALVKAVEVDMTNR